MKFRVEYGRFMQRRRVAVGVSSASICVSICDYTGLPGRTRICLAAMVAPPRLQFETPDLS